MAAAGDPGAGPRRGRLLSAAEALGQGPVLREPLLVGGHLLWLEQRPQERGRTTLLLRRRSGGAPLELTPGDWTLRSRVHAYGGGVVCAAVDDTGGLVVVFIADADRGLWVLELPADLLAGADAPLPEPRSLTPAAAEPRDFADGRLDLARGRWFGVMESDGRDRLMSVPLAGGEPVVLHEPADFCGYACLSADGTQLAWVEWEQPFMPWERSRLLLGRLDADGRLLEAWPVAGSGPGDPQGVSVFQPLWLPGGDLVVANDRSGWWNLELLAGAERLQPGAAIHWRPLLPMAAEFAMPQWVYGMATTAWDGQRLLAAACREGRWELGEVPLAASDSGWRPLAQPCDDLAGLSAGDGRLVAVASAPDRGAGLLEIDTASGHWQHHPAVACPLPPQAISRPEALWFTGHGGARCQAWFYPPAGGPGRHTPLLLRAHSGPTGMARTGLSLAIQFWTSRGWGVLDVNYGGSTGFGRAYRERLQGQWGVVDVADCAAAAATLVAAGQADPERIAMEGGSAAGFTVLALLCSSEVLRAGACRYAVTDLAALAQHGDHRFEARYLDGLIGPWPQDRATYDARSPLHNAERIERPVIFFQGLADTVVPPEQTERMALALQGRGIPVEVHLFPDEGHGFRDSGVQMRVLEATEAFFRHHFGL